MWQLKIANEIFEHIRISPIKQVHGIEITFFVRPVCVPKSRLILRFSSKKASAVIGNDFRIITVIERVDQQDRE